MAARARQEDLPGTPLAGDVHLDFSRSRPAALECQRRIAPVASRLAREADAIGANAVGIGGPAGPAVMAAAPLPAAAYSAPLADRGMPPAATAAPPLSATASMPGLASRDDAAPVADFRAGAELSGRGGTACSGAAAARRVAAKGGEAICRAMSG